MKLLFTFFLGILLSSCGSNSSPEGRMTNKINEVQKELDSLKKQQSMMLDILGKIREQLKKMESK
jgi:hypothetical protein